ncbi:MFS transporter [Allosediminivita pacifica]|uniref:SET family sugar efflux transporter-like MFS transporter n=1 Tax=Allosediminivita pacifica TaxID=1267769 RepID=A0A2T6B0P0_9RHOB|nr:MFS transporter [Allosediminivita pacifica]PTX49659.1 SET family sugar efflux transporter-like MFS transporter [Allosediminivita pacifica]GGB03612.1 MFS transporter [Allosediminivita pacifica]
MRSASLRPLVPFLFLQFTGTACGAMIIPFMGFFLVEALGQPPWMLSVYSAMMVGTTVATNRLLARRIDGGAQVFPMVGFSAACFLTAATVLSLIPALATALTIGAFCFGFSASAASTMFSLGGSMAERHTVPRDRFNAYMRATMSTAWMVGPAGAFLVADAFGPLMVFRLSALVALVWLVLWWRVLPHDVRADAPGPVQGASPVGMAFDLRMAAAFIFCLACAHALCLAALPIFYVREVGLPGYAPGLAFSVKTFIEVFAIFSTPVLISRFGIKRSLLATALLAVATIQVMAAVETFPQMVAGAALEGLYFGLFAGLGISYVQSFATGRPAAATATYWNCMMISGILAGPAAGLIAQWQDFQAVLHVASGVALTAPFVMALGVGLSRRRRTTA